MKSIIGQILFFGDMVIIWRSMNQRIGALSSCEAEYISIASAACLGVLIAHLVTEIESIQMDSLKLVDNKSEIKLRGTT